MQSKLRDPALRDKFVRGNAPQGENENFDRFVKALNGYIADSKGAATESKITIDRVPSDIFEQRFENIDAVRPYCIDREAALVDVVGYIHGLPEYLQPSAQFAKVWSSSHTDFVNGGRRVKVITGWPGSGKTEHIAAALIDFHEPPAKVSIYIPCHRYRTYSELVVYLYDLFKPGRLIRNAPLEATNSAPPTIAEMRKFVRGHLADRSILVALNNFEDLVSLTPDGEALIRDQGLQTFLRTLLSFDGQRVRIILGVNSSDESHFVRLIRRMNPIAGMDEIGRTPLPDPTLAQARGVVGKQPGDSASAVSAYDEFVAHHFPVEPGAQPIVTTVFASAFWLKPTQLTDSGACADGNEQNWRSIVSAVHNHDLRGLMTAFLSMLPIDVATVFRLICLSENGLMLKSLQLVCHDLRDSKFCPLICEDTLKGIADGQFPLIRITATHGIDGQDGKRFDVPRPVRRAVVREMQSDPKLIVQARLMHESLAKLMLRRHARSDPAHQRVAGLPQLRAAAQFVGHALASIDFNKVDLDGLGVDATSGSAMTTTYIDLQNQIIDARVCETERLKFVLQFYEAELQKGMDYQLSRMFAADGLKRDLLLRFLYIGFFIPPGQSTLAGEPQVIPPDLVQRVLRSATNNSSSDRDSGNESPVLSWAIRFLVQLALAALRTDRDALYATANSAGETLALTSGNVPAALEFFRNRLQWRYRHGHILHGIAAAERIVRRNALNLNPARSYRDGYTEPVYAENMPATTVRQIKGRLADFYVAKGDMLKAHTAYLEYDSEILSDGDTSLSTSSRRNMARCAIRLSRLSNISETVPAWHHIQEMLPTTQQIDLLLDKSRTASQATVEALRGGLLSEDRAKLLIEQSMWARFDAESNAVDRTKILVNARTDIDEAWGISDAGNMGAMTAIRLWMEDVRLSWHRIVFDPDPPALGTLSQMLRQCFQMLDRVIDVSKSRNLPMPNVDASLLKVEILNAITSNQKDRPSGASNPVIPTKLTEGSIETMRIRGLDMTDTQSTIESQILKLTELVLADTKRVIYASSYHKRIVELRVLKTDKDEVPCAKLVS